jgi:ABC-type branched-subunit amino acid transport system substrate-binding protein
LALGIYPGAQQCRGGWEIKLLVRDTQGMKGVAASLVHDLVEKEHASLLVGPVVGPVAIDAAREAVMLRVPIITLTSQPGVAGMGPLVFQHFITARNQAEDLVRFIVELHDTDRKVTVLYPDTLFGRTFCHCLVVAATLVGLKAVETVEYRALATDFGPVVKQVIACQVVATGKNISGKPEQSGQISKNGVVLVLPGSSHRLSLLLPQLFHYGLDNVLVFGSRSWHELLQSNELPRGLKKVYFVDAFSVSGEKMPAVLLQYQKRYKQQFKKEASLYDAYGYDTAILIKQVVAKLKGQTAPAMQLGEMIRTLPEMEMVTGATMLRPDGEIGKRLYRFTVEKGEVRFFIQPPLLLGQ